MTNKNYLIEQTKSKNRIASEYRSMASIDETIWAEIKENGTQDIPTNTHTPTHIYTYTSWEMIQKQINISLCCIGLAYGHLRCQWCCEICLTFFLIIIYKNRGFFLVCSVFFFHLLVVTFIFPQPRNILYNWVL